MFVLFSVGAAILYAAAFRKIRHPAVGMLYGLFWWGVIYLWAGPVMRMTDWIFDHDPNTVVTDLCLFLLWGLFIGYSISFEFTGARRVNDDAGEPPNAPKPAGAK